jgi:DME family drug/metabolite transporter
VTAAALWGSSGIFSVYLFRMGVSLAAVALWRPLLGLVFLAAYYGAFHRRELRVGWAAFAFLTGVGGAVVGIFQISYQASIDAVGVPSTVALLYLAPALVLAAAGPLLGEWPSRRRVALAALAVGGVWLSVLGAEDVPPTFGSAGVGWGMASAASYAAYTLFGRFAAPRWGAAPTLIYSTAGGCVLLALALPFLPLGPTLPTGFAAWGVLALLALVTLAAAEILFFDALRYVEASRASIAATAEPVVAALLATAILSQGLRPVGWLGLVFVVAGVAGVGMTPGQRQRRSD